MDAKYYNGEPGPEHDPGRSHGEPERYVCLDCDWTGAGAIERARHWGKRIPHHRIVWYRDPRAQEKRAKKGAA
jgi:hypothetical protein